MLSWSKKSLFGARSPKIADAVVVDGKVVLIISTTEQLETLETSASWAQLFSVSTEGAVEVGQNNQSIK